MTRLQWDQPLERSFESGVDRGVLYPGSGKAVVWNGLKSVKSVHVSDQPTPIYIDGKKVLDLASNRERSSVLTCYTYPEEFERFDGYAELDGGIVVGEQPTETFSMSYRTKIGDGNDYKIHILLNQTAHADPVDYNTLSDVIAPSEFVWNLTGVPIEITGLAPTSYIALDSRKVDPYLLKMTEESLYGTSTKDANLLDVFKTVAKITTVYRNFLLVEKEGDDWVLFGPDNKISTVDLALQVDGIRYTDNGDGSYTIIDDWENI